MEDEWEDEQEEQCFSPTTQQIDFCTLGMFIIGKLPSYLIYPFVAIELHIEWFALPDLLNALALLPI
jgi:hypothetical protein